METEEVFAAYSSGVVKIEVSEIGASAKSSLGSAFLVDPSGILMTNFHVISRLVHDPDRFEAEWSGDDAEGGEASGAVEVLAIDVVHDLALVRAEGDWLASPVLLPSKDPIEQGRRLWSFGYPLDVGKTIVEGTYNGPLKRSLARRLHFTGSLNPGMSGGPALTEDGLVVGINVAGAGEQVSFLVPGDTALDLIESSRAVEFEPRSDLLADLRDQVTAYQAHFFEGLFDDATEMVELGEFSVPSKPRSFFDCSGDVSEPDEERWRDWTEHTCTTEDYLFISGSHWSGMANFTHYWMDGAKGGRVRFFGTYDNASSGGFWGQGGDEEDITNFQCQVDHVEHGGVTWNLALCLRAYKDVPGLYDGLVRISSLLPGPDGLHSSLSLGGVSMETLESVSRRFIERIEWRAR